MSANTLSLQHSEREKEEKQEGVEVHFSHTLLSSDLLSLSVFVSFLNVFLSLNKNGNNTSCEHVRVEEV